MQGIALLSVRQEFGPPIIQQDDVIFVGAVDLAGLARSTVERVVAG
jgi:hypothetical protein